MWARRFEIEARDEGGFYYTFFRYYNELALCILFPPAVLFIERFGINKSVVLSLLIASIGMFFSVGELYSIAAFIIGSALPILINITTAVSARWFGPKGRALSTMFLI